MFGLRSSSRQTVEITVSNRTVIRVLLLVVLAVIALLALREAAHAIILIAISLFLALAFNSPVSWIARHLPGKRRGSRAWATVLSALILVLIISAFLASFVPLIVRQSTTFAENVPQIVRDIQDQNTPLGNFVARYNLEPQIQSISGDISWRIRNASGAVVSTAGQIGSSVFSAFTVLVLTFMMLVEGPKWLRRIHRFIPESRSKNVDELAGRMYRVIRGFVNGQVVLAAVAALFMLPMLFILHVPYPFALAFVVFICGLIPMIGHTIGAIIVTLLALTNSVGSAVIILLYYILYQQIENYVVQPRVQASSTDMSPLLVFVAIVIGVSFGGLLGALVAIPVMGCIRVGFLYWIELRDKNAAIAKV